MSISSIFSNSSTDPLSQLYATASTTGVTSASDTDAGTSSVSSSATSTSVSDGAKLLKQLQDLQKSDPAEFKKVTADIAAQLQAAAQQAGGSQGDALTSIANKFLQASQTGDLSALRSGHHHHGAPPPPPPTDSTASTDSSTSTASTTSVTSSATAAAIAAYQQISSQSSPLASLTSGRSTSATDFRSQVNSIISQVLTTDLGSASTTTSLSA